ncbi:hypothetical protein [Burkholderia gladioli]|nr:hypothetical protein [Burkholderia gladioli]
MSERSRDTARRIHDGHGRQQYLRVNLFNGLAAAVPAPVDTAN